MSGIDITIGNILKLCIFNDTVEGRILKNRDISTKIADKHTLCHSSHVYKHNIIMVTNSKN